MGHRAKADPIDASDLAQFAEVIQPAPTPKIAEKQQELQDLVTRRRQLIQLQTIRGKIPLISVQQTIQMCDQQLQIIEQAIAKLFESNDDWNERNNILTSVPGVGDTTARQLLAEILALGESNRVQVAALAGLAPCNHDSGKLKGRRCTAGG